jgi:hypothetical protein
LGIWGCTDGVEIYWFLCGSSGDFPLWIALVGSVEEMSCEEVLKLRFVEDRTRMNGKVGK